MTKSDGTKFGKTETGTVWLDPARTSPYRLYQFFLRTEDAIVGRYLRYFTFLTAEEILLLDEEAVAHPERRSAARALAREVCELVHGRDEMLRANRASEALFDGAVASLDEATLDQVADDVPFSTEAHEVFERGLPLVDALAADGLARSKGDARRLVRQGGISVNDLRETDEQRVLGVDDLLHGRYVVLRKGKSQYHVHKAG